MARIQSIDDSYLAHLLISDQLVNKSNLLKLPTLVITFEPQANEFIAANDYDLACISIC